MWGNFRPTVMVVALALSVLLLAACGDDQVKVNNAYVAATDRVVQSFNDEFQALQADFTPVSTPAQDLRTLTAMQATVDRAATRLARIEPPAKIAPLHRTLIARVRSYDAVIADARRGFASDDPRRIVAARARFSTRLAAVGTQIMATINTINSRLR